MAFTARVEEDNGQNNVATLGCSVPASTANDDIMFFFVGVEGGETVDTISANWNLLGSEVANDDKYYLYYKIASSEPASYTVTTTGNAKIRLVMSTYTSGDFDGADPIDQVSNTSYRVNNTTMRAAGVTVTAVDSPVVFHGCVFGPSRTQTVPGAIGGAAWTEDYDAGDTNSDYYTAIYSNTITSGATGNVDSTMSAGWDLKHAFMVVLNPVGGGGLTGAAVDGAKFGDSSSALATLYSASVEGVVLTDTPGALGTFYLSSTDGIVLADTSGVLGTFYSAAVDGVKFADTAVGSMAGTISGVVTDGIKLSDSDTIKATLYASTVDGMLLSDIATAVATLLAQTVDGVQLADVTRVGRLATGVITLTASASDASITVTVTTPGLAASASAPSIDVS